MGNGLFLALATSGGGLSPEALRAVMQMRQRNYEKLAKFIKWLATTAAYAYYWLKKRPEVLNKDKLPDYTGEGTQKYIEAFWKQQDQKDFIGNLIRDGADLLLEWLKPDDFEGTLWGSLLQHPSPAAQQASNQMSVNQLLLQLQQALGGTAAPAAPAAPAASNTSAAAAKRQGLY